MRNILITGASGFIGCALTQHLTLSGYNVHAIVKGDAVCLNKSSISNFENIISIQDLHIDGYTNWDNKLNEIDVVIHLAGKAHGTYQSDTSENDDKKIDVAGIENLAKAAIKHGVKRLVFMSSIGVNGAVSGDTPFTELSEVSPHDLYSKSKYEVENLLINITENTSLEYVILRPPLVYGHDAPGNFSRLLNIIYKGVPLPLKSISNQRSFLSKENLIDFIHVCIEHPKAANELFLIADGEDVTTTELIIYLAKGMNKTPMLWSVPHYISKLTYRIIHNTHLYNQLCNSLQVDISKSKQVLNWSSSLSLKDALYQCGKYYQEKKIKK